MDHIIYGPFDMPYGPSYLNSQWRDFDRTKF